MTLTDAAGKQSIRYREVTSGGSFGASPVTQHIGLGAGLKDGKIETIEIRWPASNTRQTLHNIVANQVIRIEESATK